MRYSHNPSPARAASPASAANASTTPRARTLRSRAALLLFALAALLAPAAALAQGRPDIQWMRGGHSNQITYISRSVDGQVIATSGADNTVKIWRSSDDQLLRTFVAPGPVFGMGLSPTGR